MPKEPLVNISTVNVSDYYNYTTESYIRCNKVIHDSVR